MEPDAARTLLDRLGPSFRSRWEGRRAEFIRDYRLDADALDGLLEFAATREVRVVNTAPAAADTTQRVIARDDARAHREEIEVRVKAYMARRLFGVDAFYPVVAALDDELLESMRLWDQAAALAAAR